MTLNRANLGRAQAAYSVAEVIVTVFVLRTLVVSLFGAFSSGLMLVRLERENLRATQILKTVSDGEIAKLRFTRCAFHGEWNYSLSP